MMRRKTRLRLATTAVVALVTLFLAWAVWQLSNSRSYQLFGDLVTRVETQDSVVALTFDDGPVPGYTDSVLAVLVDSGVVGTFFVVGAELEQHGDLARRILQAGNELGNHSYSHHPLVFKSPTYVRHEIQTTDSLIHAAGQHGAIPFRPPYGKRLVVLPWLLAQAGRATVLWDVEPDSDPAIARDPARIVDDVLRNVRPGSIILLHVEIPRRAPGRAALPNLIGSIRAAGYEFVTVSELMRRAKSS
jgi:peptidoglycan/xylan/chitin deacetylase (PgdA/CDA1 family)